MRRLSPWRRVAVALCLLAPPFAAAPASLADDPAPDEALVAVFRDGGSPKSAPSAEGATLVFDDGAFLLALASRPGIAEMRDAGWRVEVLDRDPRSKDDYYVLHRVSDEVLPLLLQQLQQLWQWLCGCCSDLCRCS